MENDFLKILRAGFGGTYAIMTNYGTVPALPPVGYTVLYFDSNSNFNTLQNNGTVKQITTLGNNVNAPNGLLQLDANGNIDCGIF